MHAATCVAGARSSELALACVELCSMRDARFSRRALGCRQADPAERSVDGRGSHRTSDLHGPSLCQGSLAPALLCLVSAFSIFLSR
eukprot:1400420-Rhodomonas_salina.1